MRQSASSDITSGALAPVLSLDELFARVDQKTGQTSFDIPDESAGPDALCEQAQATSAVTEFVCALPSRDREILRRIFWEDETQTSVAEALGVSKMAISKAVARIVRFGKQSLAAYQYSGLKH